MCTSINPTQNDDGFQRNEIFPVNLIWIIGGEGTGHHLLRAVLRDFLRKPDVIRRGPHYPLLRHLWNSKLPIIDSHVAKATFQSLVSNYATRGIKTIFEDTSFPYGGSDTNIGLPHSSSKRGALRKPDIHQMLWLLEGIPIKILVLHRSPIMTVNSALRRRFSNNLHFEAKLAESANQYIASQIDNLPHSSYRTLSFEQIIASPAPCLTALANWLGIEEKKGLLAVNRISKPTSIDQVPASRLTYLRDFFTKERCSQWDHVYKKNPLLSY